jgi:hypothetical protein|uniref:Uncharacterized protein n=1 Tax=viral metagenome TaxID=1070528 RepID=A0A6C0IV39_9ZZZZ
MNTTTTYGTLPIDLNECWFRQNPSCVFFDPPLFCALLVFQMIIVQGLNAAQRKDSSLWYVMSRIPSRMPVFAVHTQCTSRDIAIFEKRKIYNEQVNDEYSRYSPSLRQFCNDPVSTRWSCGLDEIQAGKILRQKHVLCIQASMKMVDVMYAWCEYNYVQMYMPQTTTFIDDNPKFKQIRKILEDILLARPSIVLVGIVDQTKSTYYVYDIIPMNQQHIENDEVRRKIDFARQPLIERLLHLQAIVTTTQNSSMCVKMAPFQMAQSKQEMRLHTDIFINSCDFPGVIRRVSGASDLH